MSPAPRITALIVAAGTGSRAGGGMPKQYRLVAGKPMLRHSVQRLLNHPAIGEVHVIIHPDHADYYSSAVEGLTLGAPIFGGAVRADSVRAGLAAITADYVLVHDAARPFISNAVIDRLLEKLDARTGVVPSLAVADTVRRHTHGNWEEVPRDGLQRIQTPQAFPHAMLLAAHKGNVTDEAAAWLAAGHKLEYVEGEENLRKMTTQADINGATTHRIATGSGFDVHRFVDGDHVIIGGVKIPHSHTLDGHSDADVALHALTDALLGALGEGDIGAHFPPSDPRWKGTDSKIFVAEALRLVQQRGGSIQHADITIIAEAPKIGPHRDAMRQRIANLLGLPLAYVSVKATTTEQLGFTGRREGIAAQAIATLRLPAEDA